MFFCGVSIKDCSFVAHSLSRIWWRKNQRYQHHLLGHNTYMRTSNLLSFLIRLINILHSAYMILWKARYTISGFQILPTVAVTEKKICWGYFYFLKFAKGSLLSSGCLFPTITKNNDFHSTKNCPSQIERQILNELSNKPTQWSLQSSVFNWPTYLTIVVSLGNTLRRLQSSEHQSSIC